MKNIKLFLILLLLFILNVIVINTCSAKSMYLDMHFQPVSIKNQQVDNYMKSASNSKTPQEKINYYKLALDFIDKASTNDEDLLLKARINYNIAIENKKLGYLGKFIVPHYINEEITAYQNCINLLNEANKLNNSDLGFITLYSLAESYKSIGLSQQEINIYKQLIATQDIDSEFCNYLKAIATFKVGKYDLQNGLCYDPYVNFKNTINLVREIKHYKFYKQPNELLCMAYLELSEIQLKTNSPSSALIYLKQIDSYMIPKKDPSI